MIETSAPSVRDDEEHFWRAADELLTALAASHEAHGHLAAIRSAAGRFETLRPDGRVADGGAGDNDSGSASAPSSMTAEEHAEANRLIEVLGTSGLPLVTEVLTRLDDEAIRPELVGLSRSGLDSALDVLESTYRQGAWRTLPRNEFDPFMTRLASRVEALVRTRPLRPRCGETKRIVSIVRRMPKETVVHLTRTWNPFALRIIVSFALYTFRRAVAKDARGTAD